MIEIKLTLTETDNLFEFLEMNLFKNIREDTDIDNMEWLCDMCDIYRKLKDSIGIKPCEEVAKNGQRD